MRHFQGCEKCSSSLLTTSKMLLIPINASIPHDLPSAFCRAESASRRHHPGMEVSFAMVLVAALLLQFFLVTGVLAAVRKYYWTVSLISFRCYGELNLISSNSILPSIPNFLFKQLTETNITRLCKTQEAVTVNGMFPGPTITVRNEDVVIVNVFNNAKYNASLHWHGVKQHRNPWADGPAYVTQCPISPGQNFTYKFKIKGQQGTLLWHAHYSWLRATLHGAFIILPKKSQGFPYPYPSRQEIIILGEWWNADPASLAQHMGVTGNAPVLSNVLLINGQPGDMNPCSAAEMTRITVRRGEKMLLRIVNAALNTMMFVGIAEHKMKVVALDALYTKPFETDYIVADPGQTIDVLLTANGDCGNSYYMAAHAYWSRNDDTFENTTATAIFHYSCVPENPSRPQTLLPDLPEAHDELKGEHFFRSLRSLNSGEYPSTVPQDPMDENLLYVEMPGLVPCEPNITCGGIAGEKIFAAINNVSFELPEVSILEAYYFGVPGVFTTDFPDAPPVKFNYTDTSTDVLPTEVATKVKLLKFNSSVQLVVQASGIFGGESHNFHLHGHDFHVVGRGYGNFDAQKDPKSFNLVDPPRQNTFNLPLNGWTAIRFLAENPGVWFFHCHLDYHMSIGMSMAFITLDGRAPREQMLPPPKHFPMCPRIVQSSKAVAYRLEETQSVDQRRTSIQ